MKSHYDSFEPGGISCACLISLSVALTSPSFPSLLFISSLLLKTVICAWLQKFYLSDILLSRNTILHYTSRKAKSQRHTLIKILTLRQTAMFITLYFLGSVATQSQHGGVFCDELQDCLGQQGSQTDIFRQRQMLKPNCLCPTRYCITCSKRAGAAAVISPLTLMCLNHLDREMAYCRAQADALHYWTRFNLRTHIMTDIS